MIKLLIIEDETSAHKHLNKLLGQLLEDYQVLAWLTTVEDAIQWFKENQQPDLIFMDIHLSDGISFDILEEVVVKCPIIFVTAYDQYAIKAFKTTGIEYLLKPITKEDLQAALDKFDRLQKPYSEEALLKTLEVITSTKADQETQFKERFLLKTGNNLVPVKTDEIAYFYRDEFVFAKTFNDMTYVIDYSLSQLQEMVDGKRFVRLNRQLLVNVNAIKKLTPFKPGQLSVEVNPQFHEPIRLSQERSSYLRQLLETLS